MVWGERGAEKDRRALLTLLRTGDFRQKDAVAARFMRSSVFRENDHSLRFAKHFFGSGFSGAVLSVASVGIEDEDVTVFEGRAE